MPSAPLFGLEHVRTVYFMWIDPHLFLVKTVHLLFLENLVQVCLLFHYDDSQAINFSVYFSYPRHFSETKSAQISVLNPFVTFR